MRRYHRKTQCRSECGKRGLAINFDPSAALLLALRRVRRFLPHSAPHRCRSAYLFTLSALRRGLAHSLYTTSTSSLMVMARYRPLPTGHWEVHRILQLYCSAFRRSDPTTLRSLAALLAPMLLSLYAFIMLVTCLLLAHSTYMLVCGAGDFSQASASHRCRSDCDTTPRGAARSVSTGLSRVPTALPTAEALGLSPL